MRFVHSTVATYCMSHNGMVNKMPTAIECVCCNEIDPCQNVAD